MDWLNPAIIASLAATLFLVLIYAYLYAEERDTYLGIWTISWSMYALRFIFQGISNFTQQTTFLTICDQLATWISGVLLLWGTLAFLGKHPPRWFWLAAVSVAGWIVLATAYSLPFELLTFPIFFILGGIYVWLGWQLLRSPVTHGPGKLLAGWAFIIWGLHKLDYPLLRQVDWLAPWGFLFASLLSFAVAVGVILIYNQRIRGELRQSETRFRTLFEQAPLAYQSLDQDGRLLVVNETWLEMLGYTREEVLGRYFGEFLTREHRDSFQKHFSRLISTGEVASLESEMLCKDGSLLSIASDSRISYDKAGNTGPRIQTHCILRDITARRQAVTALENKTNQLERLVDTARYMTESLDLQEVLERIGQSSKDLANAFGCSLYLLEPDGKTLAPVVALEDYADEILDTPLDVDNSLTGQAVKARRGLIFNNAYQEPGAAYIPGTPQDYDERVIATPFIVDNQVIGAMTLNRLGIDFSPEDLALAETFAAYAATALKNARSHADLQTEVKERLLAEMSLHESEERYRSLFESSSSVMLLINPETARIIDANPAACEFYGFDKDTLTSKKISEINTLPDDQVLEILRLVKERIQNQFLLEHRLANGSMRSVETFASPIKFDGQVYVFSIIHDVTERVQRKREMEAVVAVAGALRGAQTRAEMIPIVVEQVHLHLEAERASLCTRDPRTGETVFEYVHKGENYTTGDRLPPGAGLIGHVISTGKPYLTNDVQNDQNTLPAVRSNSPRAFASAPLIAKDETIGAISFVRESEIREADLRLLTAIAEIAASAIRRATHFEETERQLQRLRALHTIDIAITSSFEPESILQVLLSQITAQLSVDAAAISLNNDGNNCLNHAAGQGFLTDSIKHAQHVTMINNGENGLALHYLPELRRDGRTPARIYDLAKLEGFRAYIGVPLLAHGQLKGLLELFHRSPLDHTQEWWDFLDNLAHQAAIAIDNAELFRDIQGTNQELVEAYEATLEGWAMALELRDKETQGHSRRVTEMALRLALAIGLDDEELVELRRGTTLHDIGKMGIPDSILQKPGPLTPEEWEIMRQHPVMAYNLLSPIRFLEKALDVPYCHHEKWDGSGYPRGLKGEEIPLSARIFALVDVYDALLSDRPYRPAWSKEQTLEYIRQQAGKHFDPQVLEAFLGLIAFS